jgi:hypothetical protein
VRKRLADFLHPLQGGPKQADPLQHGWSVGRDLFVSELYAQVERVEGVNYVRRIKLSGSLLQYSLDLDRPHVPQPAAPWPEELSHTTVIPGGTRVSTMDEGKRLVLSEPNRLQDLIAGKPVEDGPHWSLAVRGFNVDDEVALYLKEERRPLNARITTIEPYYEPTTNHFKGCYTVKLELSVKGPKDAARLESLDGRLRLPVIQVIPDEPQPPPAAGAGSPAENPDPGVIVPPPYVAVCLVEGFVPGDFVSLFVGRHRLDALWRVQSTELDEERIYVPDSYLVRSGQHHVNIEMSKG